MYTTGTGATLTSVVRFRVTGRCGTTWSPTQLLRLMSFSVWTNRRTMTRDLEYYRLQPYSRTFEIRTEGQRTVSPLPNQGISRTIAGDGQHQG